MKKHKQMVALFVVWLSCVALLTSCADMEAADIWETEEAAWAQDDETEGAEESAEEQWLDAESGDGATGWSGDAASGDACESYEEEVEPGICSYIVECDDAGTCEAWGAGMIEHMEQWLGDLTYSEEWDVDEEESEKEADVIATYWVEGNDIGLEPANEDEEYYAWLWDRFSWIIPSDQRNMISGFELYDHADMMAYVIQDEDDYENWIYAANQIQATYETERIMTDIHEFGHLLSLNAEQVDPYVDENDCDTHMLDEGCANEDSYIYRFYQQFWEDGASEDEDDYVTAYAMTSVYEDFAESWSYFVMTIRPVGDSVAEAKVLFFYGYGELIMLKAAILGRAASWTDRNIEYE